MGGHEKPVQRAVPTALGGGSEGPRGGAEGRFGDRTEAREGRRGVGAAGQATASLRCGHGWTRPRVPSMPAGKGAEQNWLSQLCGWQVR